MGTRFPTKYDVGDSRLIDGKAVPHDQLRDDGQTAELYTPQPIRTPYTLGRRLGAQQDLNMLGRLNGITGALESIEIVVKSSSKTCKVLPKDRQDANIKSQQYRYKVDPDDGLNLRDGVWIDDDNYARPSLPYFDHDSGTYEEGKEPIGGIAVFNTDRTMCDVTNCARLAWNINMATSWSSGFFPAQWNHDTEDQRIFSFLPFGEHGWFTWACNWYPTTEAQSSTAYAILKYQRNQDLCLAKGYGGGQWPTETSAQTMPERILDYSGGYALCDTREVIFDDDGNPSISGGLELWHVANQEKISDVWLAQAEDIIYDDQYFGLDQAERVVSASMSPGRIALVTAQNKNVSIGGPMFDIFSSEWIGLLPGGNVWSGQSVDYDTWTRWDNLGVGNYLWAHEFKLEVEGGSYSYSDALGYWILQMSAGPNHWEFDRCYRIYIYDIAKRELSEVTLPDVEMRVHLKRDGAYSLEGNLAGGLYTIYQTWFSVTCPNLNSADTATDLYIGGKSLSHYTHISVGTWGSGTLYHEHSCIIANVADGLFYLPLSYVEHGTGDTGAITTSTGIRLYCFRLTPDDNSELPAAGYVTGPGGESDNICYYNFKHVFATIAGE